jgi:hypothetical protein
VRSFAELASVLRPKNQENLFSAKQAILLCPKNQAVSCCLSVTSPRHLLVTAVEAVVVVVVGVTVVVVVVVVVVEVVVAAVVVVVVAHNP